ncbi:MAG TPA: type II toxin-antitoxin system RelE/ParE family toxin [Pirellulales bacterium]
MSLSVRLQIAAECEYNAAVDWHEAEQPGLGLRFFAAVDRTIESIRTHPTRWPEELPGVRAARVSGWPYRVFYRIGDDHVLIVAVFHTSRDPTVWQARL